MPSLPLRNVLIQNATRAAADIAQDDLPVNPLLVILYTLKFQQNAASTTTDVQPKLKDALNCVSRLEVLFRGSSVVSGSLADIAVMNAILGCELPLLINQGDAAARNVAITVPILLGRPGALGLEAFPATRRGELTLRREFAASFAPVKATLFQEQVETVELLGAEPAAFLKYVTLSKTFVTTGDNDVDLPMGNPLLGTLLFGTTGYDAMVSVATWKAVKLMVESVEYMYALANWETLNGELQRRIGLADQFSAHTHTDNLAAAYAADVASGGTRPGANLCHNYAWLDYDPFQTGETMLETRGRGRVHLRATAGTADAARALPLELVGIGAGAAAAT